MREKNVTAQQSKKLEEYCTKSLGKHSTMKETLRRTPPHFVPHTLTSSHLKLLRGQTQKLFSFSDPFVAFKHKNHTFYMISECTYTFFLLFRSIQCTRKKKKNLCHFNIHLKLTDTKFTRFSKPLHTPLKKILDKYQSGHTNIETIKP